jgi:hypothetical protein
MRKGERPREAEASRGRSSSPHPLIPASPPWHCDRDHLNFSPVRSAGPGSPRFPAETALLVTDAGPDGTSAAPVVPRHKLPEHYALAAVREEAFANGTTPPPGVTLADADTHRGQAAGFEAAALALRSHRRLSDAVEMLRRLMQRLEHRGDETVYPSPWRAGYLRAVSDAVTTIERTLAAEHFDATRERRLERRMMRIEMER